MLLDYSMSADRPVNTTNYGGLMKRLLASTITIIYLANPSITKADELNPDQIKELITWRAQVHGAPIQLMLNVAYCESKYNPNAVGKRGERGIFQWLPGRGNAWDATSAYNVVSIDIQERYATHDVNAVFFDIDSAAELFAIPAMRRAHWASTINLVC
jgi:Transglycosylase SLT domain